MFVEVYGYAMLYVHVACIKNGLDTLKGVYSFLRFSIIFHFLHF